VRCRSRRSAELHLARRRLIHTRTRTKYSEREIAELADADALRVDARWLDSGNRFCVALLAAALAPQRKGPELGTRRLPGKGIFTV